MTMENGIEEESNCELEHEEEGTQQSNINISDVIEVIQTTDPTFESAAHRWGDDMFSGGGPLPGPSHAHHEPHPQASLNRRSAYARIIEQPASKALRFRYECEGRSAGSIPGVNSTAENKTYPTLEIVGYKGRAVVVVSCVTKDPFPYRPHPHNLVGKDGCKKGVCTVEINSESMCVSFSNLGIQCVKKKDIEEALRVREEIRVDPFRTGFSHRSQPTSIDLNAVRLCFQVFLEGSEKGRFTQPLKPVVSDVVYDKKAMNDLVICKMSHCSATVAGGQEIILLCEKVTKEDIKIRFYEESNGQVAWESYGDFQHANVHKQFAISFKAPRYKTLEVDQPVKVCIQLQRPSDGATSEPLPFELLPLDSGRTGLLYRRRKTDYSLMSQILAGDVNRKLKNIQQPTPNSNIDGNNNSNHENTYPLLNIPKKNKQIISEGTVDLTTPTDEVKHNGSQIYSDGSDENIDKIMKSNSPDNHDKNLNELLDQVAELDEIYSENQIRLNNMPVGASQSPSMSMDVDEFDDRRTYSSLQLAFKNPVSIVVPELTAEEVITHKGPIIELTPLKRDTEEKLPPLPPKRIRKTPSMEALNARPRAQTLSIESTEHILKPGQQIPLSRSPSQSQQTINQPHSMVTRSVDRLPTDLPATPKKKSFLSRIFNRKQKDKSPPRDGKTGKAVGRSASSVSGQRPSKYKQDISHTSLKGSSGNLSLGTSLRYTDSITHISLHGDNESITNNNQNHNTSPVPPTDGETILVAENVLALDAAALKKIQDNLDLTDAEHYALYMALAPHATVSEFDELSCYYSPVEGGKFPLMPPSHESKI